MGCAEIDLVRPRSVAGPLGLRRESRHGERRRDGGQRDAKVARSWARRRRRLAAPTPPIRRAVPYSRRGRRPPDRRSRSRWRRRVREEGGCPRAERDESAASPVGGAFCGKSGAKCAGSITRRRLMVLAGGRPGRSRRARRMRSRCRRGGDVARPECGRWRRRGPGEGGSRRPGSPGGPRRAQATRGAARRGFAGPAEGAPVRTEIGGGRSEIGVVGETAPRQEVPLDPFPGLGRSSGAPAPGSQACGWSQTRRRVGAGPTSDRLAVGVAPARHVSCCRAIGAPAPSRARRGRRRPAESVSWRTAVTRSRTSDCTQAAGQGRQ